MQISNLLSTTSDDMFENVHCKGLCWWRLWYWSLCHDWTKMLFLEPQKQWYEGKPHKSF